MTKNVLHKSNKLVHGIGIKGMDYSTKVDGKPSREYGLWTDMLLRCTKDFQGNNLTYTGTTCSENFKSYTFFYEWCNKQVGFSSKDENGKSWHLDKDLLVKGNKVYSEDTCVFVPLRLNLLLVKRDKSRGSLPIGVSWSKTRLAYIAACHIGYEGERKSKNLGGYSSPEEAFQAYKNCKEACIRQAAEQYKAKIDSRVYSALLNYIVSITD
jgi:hypothetical protein